MTESAGRGVRKRRKSGPADMPTAAITNVEESEPRKALRAGVQAGALLETVPGQMYSGWTSPAALARYQISNTIAQRPIIRIRVDDLRKTWRRMISVGNLAPDPQLTRSIGTIEFAVLAASGPHSESYHVVDGQHRIGALRTWVALAADGASDSPEEAAFLERLHVPVVFYICDSVHDLSEILQFRAHAVPIDPGTVMLGREKTEVEHALGALLAEHSWQFRDTGCCRRPRATTNRLIRTLRQLHESWKRPAGAGGAEFLEYIHSENLRIRAIFDAQGKDAARRALGDQTVTTAMLSTVHKKKGLFLVLA